LRKLFGWKIFEKQILIFPSLILMDISQIQAKIREGNPINSYEVDELKYMQTPIGKEIYKNSENKKLGRPKVTDKAHWSDKVRCEYCNIEILRSNQSSHKKTKKHQLQLKINKKLRDLLVE
jgi:hypothetical protein